MSKIKTEKEQKWKYQTKQKIENLKKTKTKISKIKN